MTSAPRCSTASALPSVHSLKSTANAREFTTSISSFDHTHPTSPLATATMDAFATKAGRSIFARNLKQYEPKDPLYETYVDDRGRQRRRKVRRHVHRL